MSRSFNKFAQTLLGKQGFGVAADGRDTTEFRNAIRDFQKQNGLPVTGMVTTDTLNALKRPIPPLPRERPAQAGDPKPDMGAALSMPPVSFQPSGAPTAPPVPDPVLAHIQATKGLPFDQRYPRPSAPDGNFSNAEDVQDPLGLQPYLRPDLTALQQALQQKADAIRSGSVNFQNADPYGNSRDTGPIDQSQLIKMLMQKAAQVGGGV